MIRHRNTDIISKRIKYNNTNDETNQRITEDKKLNETILEDLKREVYGTSDMKYNILNESYENLKTEFEILNNQAIYYKNRNLEYETQINNSYNKIEEIEKELNKLKTPKINIYNCRKSSIPKYIIKD